MGTGLSLPKDSINVGKINRNAPNLYRYFGVPDHLYPYEIKKSKTRHPDVELAMALEAFNSIVTCKLDLEDSNKYLGKSEIEIFKKILNPEKSLHSALISGADTKDLKIEIGADDKQIYLCRSYLVELNEAVCRFKSITILQICCNYLKYLPYGIGQLKGLRMLIVSRNRITEIPDEIGLCRELKEIDISFNLIKKLPKSLVCLKKLNTLQIGGNLLKEIPSFLGKMNSLKYLNISSNQIKSIPLEIFKLPFLLILNANGCPLNKNKKTFELKGKITLNELLIRNVIRKNMSLNKFTHSSAISYVLGAQECSFCGGPFFDSYVNVEDYHVFETITYPIHYKMCCLHYKKHGERLSTLFERTLPTFPIKIFDDNLPSISELFEPYCYDTGFLESCLDNAADPETIPLVCLSLFKDKNNRPNKIDLFKKIDRDNTAFFDYLFEQYN